MVFHNPGDPLVAYALAKAIDNIENKISHSVWNVTGPSIMTSLHRSNHPDKERLFAGIVVDDVVNVRKFVQFKSPAYKEVDHWTTQTDIFREPA